MNAKRFTFAAAVLAATGIGLAAQAQKPAAPLVVVYKTSTCGCCSNWVAHLRQNGFQVEAHDVAQARLNQMGGEVGITQDLASCHTAKVDGYYVEGHVPAADIHKMLKERPKITGIAAPGMPIGSPGMEQGGAKDPYDVVAFTKGGPAERLRAAPLGSPRAPASGRCGMRSSCTAAAVVVSLVAG